MVGEDIVPADGGDMEEWEVDPNEVISLDIGKLSKEMAPKVMARVIEFLRGAEDVLAEIDPETVNELVIPIPKEFQPGLDNGRYVFNWKPDGAMLPDIWEVGENGARRMKKRLVAEERAGKDPAAVENLSNDLYMLAIRQQMTQMVEAINEVREVVEGIRQGQDDDRFAKITAGEKLLRLAARAEDEETRRSLTVSAIQELLEGSDQIAAALRLHLAEMTPVPKGDVRLLFEMVRTQGYIGKKDGEFDKAQDYFAFLDKAWGLIAFSAISLGETEMLPEVFSMARKTMEGLPLGSLRSVGRLHPAIDLSEEWFSQPGAYLQSGEESFARLAENAGSFMEIRVDGRLLLEAMSDGSEDEQQGDEGEGSGEEPLQEDE